MARFIELDLEVVPERFIALPVLESYALPELSIMRVLGADDDVLPTDDDVLVVGDAVLVETEELLPDVAVLVLPSEEALPEVAPEMAVLFAELVL